MKTISICSATAKLISLEEGFKLQEQYDVLLATGAKLYPPRRGEPWEISGYAADGRDANYYIERYQIDLD